MSSLVSISLDIIDFQFISSIPYFIPQLELTPLQGAGTFAAGDGSRQPTPLELGVAKSQGKFFAQYMAKHWH